MQNLEPQSTLILISIFITLIDRLRWDARTNRKFVTYKLIYSKKENSKNWFNVSEYILRTFFDFSFRKFAHFLLFSSIVLPITKLKDFLLFFFLNKMVVPFLTLTTMSMLSLSCRPQITIATAIMFCHRFYLHQSHAKNEWQVYICLCTCPWVRFPSRTCHSKWEYLYLHFLVFWWMDILRELMQ